MTHHVIISYFLCCEKKIHKKTIHIVTGVTGVTLQTHCTYGHTRDPNRKVALKTSPQHHLTKQQRHFGQSEAHQSSKPIFEASRGISLALG